jgi:acetylserotonin N-methyltransferase
LVAKNGASYANTPAATTYLCHESPRRLTGYVSFSNEFLWKLWGNLEDAVREGTHRWPQEFGWEGPIFSNFFRSDETRREFLMGMHGFGLISSPQVVAAFDLSRFRRLVDLGGATGHLALAACARFPSLQAVVFDLPEALDLAREMIAATPLAGRVSVQGGDFFTDPLPQADLYALGRILHDWTEEKIVTLLSKIHRTLPAGGAVLIAEKLLDEDRTGPMTANLQSLNMLVCTEGRERTLSEYTALLKQAGFTNVEAGRTATPLDAVLAVKHA